MKNTFLKLTAFIFIICLSTSFVFAKGSAESQQTSLPAVDVKSEPEATAVPLEQPEPEPVEEPKAAPKTDEPRHFSKITMKYEGNGTSFCKTISTFSGTEIKLPVITLYNRALVFKGWGVSEDKVTYQPGDTINMPSEELVLYAIFETDPSFTEGKSIQVEYSNSGKIKCNNIEKVSFNIKNNGTESLGNIKISLTSDDPLLVILNENLSCRRLDIGTDVNATYSVISKAPSGTELKAVLTVTDDSDSSWTEYVIFTVE